MNIALVAPHMFMQDTLLDKVIFSPGFLAQHLADALTQQGDHVTLFTPGPVITSAQNSTADISGFEAELAIRGDSYLDLLGKHPLTFISLARAVQAQLIADAFKRANQGEFDVVHMYMNEEEQGLVFASLCSKPVIFTHHDPFNFSAKYRSVMPQYKHLPWISISNAQRQSMPTDTNWLTTIYHGLPLEQFTANKGETAGYIAYLGRVIEPKGVHLAIQAVQHYNKTHKQKLKLKIAGKHYSGAKDSYWQKIAAHIDGQSVEYIGHLSDVSQKQQFLSQANALIIPSTFDEPFGMVMIESLACGTPIIGLDSGAIPEIIQPGSNGLLVKKILDKNDLDQVATSQALAEAFSQISLIKRSNCRADFEQRFTLKRMATEHQEAYQKALKLT